MKFNLTPKCDYCRLCKKNIKMNLIKKSKSVFLLVTVKFKLAFGQDLISIALYDFISKSKMLP